MLLGEIKCTQATSPYVAVGMFYEQMMGLVQSRSWEPQQTQTFEMKTNFQFGVTHLHLHDPGLNVCRYCKLRCFKSPKRSTVLWQVSWTSKRRITTACQPVNVVQECWLAYTYVRSAAYAVLNLQSVVQFCGYLNFKTTNYHSLPTPHCSAGMLVRLHICTLSSLHCFKSPTSRTILWLLELKHDE